MKNSVTINFSYFGGLVTALSEKRACTCTLISWNRHALDASFWALFYPASLFSLGTEYENFSAAFALQVRYFINAGLRRG